MEKGSNIFEGEALESDDDDESNKDFSIPVTSPRYKSETSSKKESKVISGELPSSSFVVPGEDSESDDAEEEILDEPISSSTDRNTATNVVVMETRKRRFQSPFHKKIWERNFALRLGIVQSRLDCYDNIINKLKTFIPIANRSQLIAQDTLKNYKHVSQSTKILNDNLEGVLQQADLPDIHINY